MTHNTEGVLESLNISVWYNLDTGTCSDFGVIVQWDPVTKWRTFFQMSRWRYQMETFSALLALCEGNPPVADGFPSQRPVTRSFDVFFDLRLNKWLSKQSRRRWFETPLHSFWCLSNGTEISFECSKFWYIFKPNQGIVECHNALALPIPRVPLQNTIPDHVRPCSGILRTTLLALFGWRFSRTLTLFNVYCSDEGVGC